MSNAFRRDDESIRSPTSPARDYLPEANFFETPSAGFRLLSAGRHRAPAVQDWDLGYHSLATR